jgi:hypothetical protein
MHRKKKRILKSGSGGVNRGRTESRHRRRINADDQGVCQVRDGG